ncbi:MAG: hypothetical protein DWQ44_07380 [Bacteroidetes bacterium]|nr:MAG: hypothetical protein DWQ33_12305 [Bacteroidota bacterium]REJ99835.1 MAG: hypothetical protein DWQ39_13000 [Bacteroidota bacterium]REK34208.1 MAG: hypothetical protein DWQ44_07380 [Bacteroidota bacterium]REK50538.1 MAG: hypothetical protein DWQ48_04290 [Bacteroidota bacterium]
MKKIVFSLILSAIFGSVSAQKAKVQTAYNYWKEPYQQFDKAKEAIDEASQHEQSRDMAKTWYYKGVIYSSLYQHEKYGSLCDNCLLIAFQSFEKAMDLDPKNEWAKEIQGFRMPFLVNKIFSLGVDQFKNQNFNEALNTFEQVQKMTPGDTSAILNSAYSAERSGESQKAIDYYSKLIDMKYEDEKIYSALANIYRGQAKNDKALEVISSGKKAFPGSLNLMLTEINILLSTGKDVEATKALDDAIAKDPENPSLYLALGSTYDNLANPRNSEGKDLPKPTNAAEYLRKAEESYKRGLTINPDHYEINYNLGALYFNQAAEMANAANKITNMQQYDKEKAKFDQKFKDAEPHLIKAMNNNPKLTEEDGRIYQGTLISLKQLYARINDMEKHNQIKALLEEKK